MKKIKQLSIAVTDKCNAKCTQCSIWKRKPREEFTLGELEKMFQNSDFSAVQSISISGGEPILRKDMIALLKTIRKYYQRGVVLQTNSALPEKVLEVASSIKNLSVCVSLDGIGKTHDKIRGVPGLFEKAMKVADGLRKRKIPFTFSMTLQPSNQSEILDVYELAKKHKAVFSCRPAGIGHFFDKKRQKPLDTKLIISQLKKIYKINPMWIRANIDFLKNGRLPFPCFAGETSCIILPDLSVYPCSHGEIDWKLGNLREVNYNLDKLLTRKYSRNCQRCINDIAHPADLPKEYLFRYEVPNLKATFILRRLLADPKKVVSLGFEYLIYRFKSL
jgi:MoaA/NifB/PqqE/SkfB family radical SAM enzyme